MNRTSLLAVLAGLGLTATAFASCTATPSVAIVTLSPNEKFEAINKGDPVKFRRGSQDGYGGMRSGYFVVRQREDWNAAWPENKAPNMPPTLDTTRQMLILGHSDRKDTPTLELKKIIETGGIIHVWAKEVRYGEGCPQKSETVATDALTVERIDKPVKFWVEEEHAESCGKPPAASVKCRIGDAQTWATALKGQPGDIIDCEMNAESRGKFALVDNVLSLAEAPGGSMAKIAYSKGSSRGTLQLDVLGTYTVKAEAADESGRRTTATATIEVSPPKTRDVLVQLVWSNFDANDDPSTFPRVTLRATEEGPKGKEVCSSDDEVPLTCDVKKKAAYAHMKLRASDKKTPLDLTYTDERVDKGPLVCVNVYYDGARTAEACDRKPRAAGDTWQIGTLDMATGKIGDALAPVVDAGAPEAGAKKPLPKKK